MSAVDGSGANVPIPESGEAAHGDPGRHDGADRCQFVELPDGDHARLHGADQPLSDDARAAFVKLAESAKAMFAEEHADDTPALTTIADGFAHRARTSGLSLAEAAEKSGCDRVAAIRLMQCSGKLTVAELAAFARWAGLDIVAVPAAGREIREAIRGLGDNPPSAVGLFDAAFAEVYPDGTEQALTEVLEEVATENTGEPMSDEDAPDVKRDDLVVLLVQVDPASRDVQDEILRVVEEVATGRRGIPVAATTIPAAELDRDDPDRPAANGALITLAALDHASEQGRRAEALDRQLAAALLRIAELELATATGETAASLPSAQVGGPPNPPAISRHADENAPDEPVVQRLAEHYRHLGCPGTVDPDDPEDCACVASETVRFLRQAGLLHDGADHVRLRMELDHYRRRALAAEKTTRSQAGRILDMLAADGTDHRAASREHIARQIAARPEIGERVAAFLASIDEDDPDPAVATVVDCLVSAGQPREDAHRLTDRIIGALCRNGHLAAVREDRPREDAVLDLAHELADDTADSEADAVVIRVQHATPDPGWWVDVPNRPGLAAQGDDVPELLRNLADAWMQWEACGGQAAQPGVQGDRGFERTP